VRAAGARSPDDGAAEQHECQVQLVVALVAGAQPTQVVQVREGPLDHPPLAAQPRAVALAAPRDHRLDAAGPQLTAVLVVVIAAVGQQPLGALARPADLAAHRPDAVDERKQLGDVVAVPAGQADGQRDTAGIGEQDASMDVKAWWLRS
jgi:hypothetical protein